MAHAGGHLVHQQDTHCRVAAQRGVLAAGTDDDVHLTGAGVRLLPRLQQQVDAVRAQPLHIVVGRTGVQRQPRRVAPVAGALIGPVAHEPQAAARPVAVGRHRLLLHRHGDRRRADAADEVGAAAAEHHLQPVVIRRRHLQRLRIAQHRPLVPRHHGQGVGIGAGRLRIHQPPPCVHEIAGRDGGAVRPFGVSAQLERVRHRAVQRRLLRIAASQRVGHRAVRVQPHQVLKHMLHHRALRRRGHLGRIHGMHRTGHDHRQLLLVVGVFAAGRQQHRHAKGQQQRRRPSPDSHKPLLRGG